MQTQKLEGREHLVVPVTMLVVGVVSGSGGAIYYPPEALSRSAKLWNGRPLLIGHPVPSATAPSGTPQTFDRQRVGFVFNSRFSQTKLQADAWVDVERLRRLDSRILQTLYQFGRVSVSTGVGADIGRRAGIFNGTKFHSVARDLRPDHLAILPDSPGACSIAQGCYLGAA